VIIVGAYNHKANNIQPMASLNFEQWHEWSTQIQDEHSKLNNTECCVCYSYEVLNKNVCGQCKNYVCHECSDKLQHNECPICRTSGIVKDRPIEPRENDIENDILEFARNHNDILDDIWELANDVENDILEFARNHPRRARGAANHTRIPQQREAAAQNTSPYVSDDGWFRAQGYIRGSVDMPTGGYAWLFEAEPNQPHGLQRVAVTNTSCHGYDADGVYTSRHAYHHTSSY